jgi:acylphosphatase
MVIRVRACYSGDVQGVGFRHTASSVAKRYPVTGSVKNLYDGRVEIVAEGEEVDLKDFLSEVKDKMRLFSFTDSVSWLDPTGEFDSFRITF